MGKSQKIETSHLFTPVEAAAYLRDLADKLETGTVELEQAELELSEQVKVKESIKDKVGRRSIKIKIKLAGSGPQEAETAPPDPEATDEPPSAKAAPSKRPAKAAAKARKPSYKRLKKNMADSFKTLRAAARQGETPDRAVVADFMDQCRLMVSYPDKGEPYYDDFTQAAEALARAVEGSDADGLTAALDELGRLRKNCHRRFK